jgi:hypothetical protein
LDGNGHQRVESSVNIIKFNKEPQLEKAAALFCPNMALF